MNFFNRFRGVFNFRGRKKQKTAQSVIPLRLNILLWLVGLLLLMLAARLFYLQVLNGAAYKAEVKRSDTTIQTNNVQRGMIYDDRGKVIVGNQTHQAITYTKGADVTTADLYRTANQLGRYLTVSTAKLTHRNQEDYYLADKANLTRLIRRAQLGPKVTASTISPDQYNKLIDYLNAHPQLYRLTPAEKNRAMIFASMTGAYSLSTTYIKQTGVTATELAAVGEHLSSMPGVKIGTAWTRNYPEGKDFQTLTGTVSTNGLPANELNILLAQGYSRNDSVGQSYLEKEYQATLAGAKSQTEVTANGSTVAKSVTKYAGQKGDNLVLTINAKFQKEVQSILERDYPAAGIGTSTGAYAVVMNPNTGAVYAMAGLDHNPETGKTTVDEVGAINHPITLGSVVKGATILGAMMDGVITPENSALTDQPIRVAGTSVKGSWFNKSGAANVGLNAATALEVSSNSYMMQLIMKEGGMHYTPGTQLTLKPSIFQKERGYFNMFGLGTKTGIDIPGETAGYVGPSAKKNIGSALDLSYGNYDGYTVIQLAQYMSTIANGGRRMRPYVVKQIQGTKPDGSLGAVKYTAAPQVQQVIPASKGAFDIVKQGLYLVTHGSSPYVTAGNMKSESPSISGKTGTAETFYKKTPTTTLSFAGYAPSDNPQVVVALSIPGASNSDGEANIQMAKDIFSAYWKTVQDPKPFK